MSALVAPSTARSLSRLPEKGGQLAIEAHELTKIYPGNVQALNGLSISVPAGAIFGLLGPNGAGKSTTVKILTTLSKPNSGSARVAGFDILTEAARVRRSIGVVSQKSGIDGQLTGRENLVLQGQVYGLKNPEVKTRIAELLDRFHLTEAADRVARTYSGGMQRKLDIAMGLIQRPRVLFLDEPTTGLDPEARAELWAEISRLSTVEGLTILLTTHYLEEADKLADRIAIVDRGRVVVEGAPEELKGELQGDAIHVEFPETPSPERIRATLLRVPGVSEIVVNDRSAYARVDRGATAVPAALTALETDGIPVSSVTVSRPSLDDVYLRYAGRAYGANNGGENHR
jgi:ABC-2 type transport system ATP-binding protein